MVYLFKSKIMKYIGWVLFGWGLFLFVMMWVTIGTVIGNEKDFKEWWFYQTLSIMTIGVGGYLIKNFTEKK